jgi:radical SAM superfamily enzyme YgiQ (UPF0313 family)
VKVKLYNCLNDQERIESEYALGLGYLKTNCAGAGIEIVTDRAELVDCDLIGLSAVVAGINEAIDISESTSIPVVIGGQCTLWEGLEDYPFLHIVKGEGERAMQEIIDGTTKRVLIHDKIEDIDTLNFPDRGRCGNVLPIVSSRGCPWNCNFCSSQKYWGAPRYHSAEYFCAEVDHLLKKHQKANVLYIQDDLFIANLPRFEQIYELWMKGDYKQLGLSGFVRSNLMTKDIAVKLKKMGFLNVRFGAESGSNRMLKLLNKQTTVETHQRCIDICNEVGLPVCFSLLVYPPGEEPADRNLTAEFIFRNRNKAWISGNFRFQPFPGTKYYNGEDVLKNYWGIRPPRKLNLFSEEGKVN